MHKGKYSDFNQICTKKKLAKLVITRGTKIDKNSTKPKEVWLVSHI